MQIFIPTAIVNTQRVSCPFPKDISQFNSGALQNHRASTGYRSPTIAHQLSFHRLTDRPPSTKH